MIIWLIRGNSFSLWPDRLSLAIQQYYWRCDESGEWRAVYLIASALRADTFIPVWSSSVGAYTSAISIEVGLWGSSPRKTWIMAKRLNINRLTLVLHPNTSIDIPTKHRNDREYLYGNKDLWKIRAVQVRRVIWVLKAGGVQRPYRRCDSSAHYRIVTFFRESQSQ